MGLLKRQIIVCGLATNAALTTVENKIPHISSFVKKANYNIKINNVEKKFTDYDHKYITTDDKLRSLNQKINSKKTKYLLVENEFKKLQTFDSIYLWKSKGLSDETITATTTTNYNLSPQLSCFGTKTSVEFKASCLKQDEITFDHRQIINMYIIYEINENFNTSSYPTLASCLFGALRLNKNTGIDKYKYFGYGIGFQRHRFFSYPSVGTCKNSIIFGVDMS